MDEIIDFTQRNIPISVLLPSFVILCIVVVLIIACRLKKWKKWILVALFVEYEFLVIWTTLITRAVRAEFRYELIPYWNIKDIVAGKAPLDILEICLNIILFIPIGMLMAGVKNNWSMWNITIAGCSMSITIELLQLFLRCGLCETNDVIHNTIGCAMGVWMTRRVSRRLRH